AAPVPVWVGGASPGALRRAALFGDGWVPLFCDPATFATRLAEVRELRAAAGGDPDDLTAAVVMVARVGDDGAAHAQGAAWLSRLYGISPRAFERHLVAGTADRVAEGAHRYFSAGAAHVVVLVAADHPMEQFSALMEAAAPSTPDPAAVPHSAMAGASV
ncbi:MAG: LLM class flavin-dependent oxidoreductase, partial [Acidimicrobiales bacterium]